MHEMIERELDWDDEIERDGSGFRLLPPGDYRFRVRALERERYAGSAKMPPCAMAVLSLEIDTPEGAATVNCTLFLHTKFEWKLCQFFTSIGQRKHGEKLKMNWQAVPGSAGRCKIGVRTFKKKDGNDGESNEVLEFYEPAQTAARAEAAWTPGAF